jgi:hypothetical protein
MKIGVTYTYTGIEGTNWGYTQIEANSIKEAEHKATEENQNLENFKIQEVNVVLEGKIKEFYQTDEGASMCYDCYEKDPISTLIADLKTRYGYFEFADHISKPKMDAFVEWFKDAANQIHAIGYKHGMEDKIKEKTK